MDKGTCSVDECERPTVGRGWCRTHYARWRKHGTTDLGVHLYVPRTGKDIPTIERFWAKVNKTETCWLWTGALNTPGYGQIRFGGRTRMAHRYSYETLVGPIPEGLELDHLCRVPACVNPDHLEPVTHRENGIRGNGLAGIAVRKTHCVNGHPLIGDNLAIWGGKRACRTCRKANRKAARQRELDRDLAV